MTAYEIFNLMVNDLRNLEVLVSEEIEEKGENDNLSLLKKYLEKTRVEYGKAILPIPFNSPSTNNRLQFAVYITVFLCALKELTFKIFCERRNIRTGRIYPLMDGIYEKYTKLIIEQLE